MNLSICDPIHVFCLILFIEGEMLSFLGLSEENLSAVGLFANFPHCTADGFSGIFCVHNLLISSFRRESAEREIQRQTEK